MQLKHPAFGVVTIACAAIAVAVVAAAGSPPAGIVVTVDPSTDLGTVPTWLGTQFVGPGTLDTVVGTRVRFSALAPPLVRINATTFGPAPVLPAGKTKGDWTFESLNSIVSDVGAAHGAVLLTVAYAPEWMWDCPNGGIRDATFSEFGDYMARLVGYFNRGSFVAEDGRRIANPAGLANRIAYWELWNEPDQMKGCPPAGNQISPAQYVAMWNGAVPKMLSIDPTIKITGPAVERLCRGLGRQRVSTAGAGGRGRDLRIPVRASGPSPVLARGRAYRRAACLVLARLLPRALLSARKRAARLELEFR